MLRDNGQQKLQLSPYQGLYDIIVPKDEMKVRQVHAHIYVDNSKSIRLIERFGFTFSSEIEICHFRGQQYLHNIYSLDCFPTELASRNGKGFGFVK